MADIGDSGAANDLLAEMIRRAAGIGGDAWRTQQPVIAGYLRDLAADAIRTAQAIAAGQVDRETAAEIWAMHRRAHRSIETYAELSALQTAQAILDMALGLAVDAIRSRTGIDLGAIAAG